MYNAHDRRTFVACLVSALKAKEPTLYPHPFRGGRPASWDNVADEVSFYWENQDEDHEPTKPTPTNVECRILLQRDDIRESLRQAGFNYVIDGDHVSFT